MSDNKNLNEKVDELEAAAKKYASKDTVISIGGYEFTPAKLMVAFTIVSSTLGGLYGAFEVYKDYQSMKDKIAKYVSPDLTEIYKKLEVIDKEMAGTRETVTQATDYSNNIKNDLKTDVRRLESVIENLERSTKSSQRDTDATVKEMKKDVDSTLKEVRRYSDQTVKDVNQEMTRNQKESLAEIRALRKEIDDKIKKALDNPLSNN